MIYNKGPLGEQSLERWCVGLTKKTGSLIQIENWEVNWGQKSPINILPMSLKRLPPVRSGIHFFAFSLELSIILDSSDNWLNNRQWIGHWNPVIRLGFLGQSIMGGSIVETIGRLVSFCFKVWKSLWPRVSLALLVIYTIFAFVLQFSCVVLQGS